MFWGVNTFERHCKFLSWERPGHLLYDEADAAVQLQLSVDSLGTVVLVTFQEQVFECRRVFLLERHDHLVAQTEQHQLGGEGKTPLAMTDWGEITQQRHQKGRLRTGGAPIACFWMIPDV